MKRSEVVGKIAYQLAVITGGLLSNEEMMHAADIMLKKLETLGMKPPLHVTSDFDLKSIDYNCRWEEE